MIRINAGFDDDFVFLYLKLIKGNPKITNNTNNWPFWGKIMVQRLKFYIAYILSCI